SSAAAPSLRRMSAASSAAAMISLVLRIWSATGPMGTRPPSDPTGPVRCWGAAERMSASSWVGLALVIWAAAVDPADVPMIRSASVTSNPASNRPAMTPINHPLPADPPPPRANARSPAARTRLVGVCQVSGVTDLVGLLPSGGQAAIEGDVERIESGLPPVGPAFAALPGRVQAHDRQVQALEGGLLGGEVAAGVHRPPQPGIDRLDRISRADDCSYFPVEGQEWHELCPRVLPQPYNSRVAFLPL